MSDDIKLPSASEFRLALGELNQEQLACAKGAYRLAYARAAVELNRAWLPIESAPKDGANFIGAEFHFGEDGAVIAEDYTICFRGFSGELVTESETVFPNYYMSPPPPPEHGEG